MSDTMDVENDVISNPGPSGSSSVTPEQAPHLMRVTDHHKMKNLVRFALDFLVANISRPLVLHTMPLATSSTQGHETEKESLTRQSWSASKKCTTSVPKLISIVEIIKREFPKALRSHLSSTSTDGGGGTSLSPNCFDLHQYNEVGCMEELYPSIDEEPREERAERIIMLLKGKNHLKIQRTPYMKITLSRQPIPSLADGGIATYQAPVPFKYSKAQKARAKKRASKLAAATNVEADELAGESGSTQPQPHAPTAVISIVGNKGSIVL